MKKQVYTTWLLCLLVTLSFAQQDLTVKIVDPEQAPLAGANVTIGGNTQLTNQSGIVQFQNLKNQNYTIKVSHLGFYEKRNQINPTNNPNIVITLAPGMLVVDDVFVYATRAKENSATTFKNISKEDIRKTNLGQDIPYLLDQTPGVVIGSDAGAGIGYTNMTIRGSDNQRINVTLNGIPLNDAESMGSFFVNLPDFASSVESIQIQRGVGTSTNGAGAFGASLNIQTDALEITPYAELNNSFGSFNSWKNTIKAGTGLINNKYAFNTRLSRIVSDGYIERASSDLKSFYFDGGLYTEKHTLKATIFSGKEKTYQAWNGVPEPLIKGDRSLLTDYAYNAIGIYGGPEMDRLLNADRTYNQFSYNNQTDNYTQTHAHLHYTSRINDKVNLNAALHYTRGAGYYEEYRADNKFTDYGLQNVLITDDDDNIIATISRTDLIRRRWLDNHFYGLTYSANYQASNNLNFTLGGAANQYKGDHYGQVIWAQYASNSTIDGKYYLNDAKKTDINIYAKADYKLDSWLFNLDVQGRHINYQGEGDDNKIKNLSFEDNLLFINPKFGMTYFLNNNTNIYLSYAYAGKEPVRKDYVENPRNEFPKPEFMQDIEAGYRFKNEQFNFGANLYAMLYKDQLIPTGALNDTGGALRVNIPTSHRIGAELDAAWVISKQFTWKATVALSENKIKNFVEYYTVYDNENDWNIVAEKSIDHGKTNIAMSPSAILSNDITFFATPDLSFGLLSKYVSRMYMDNTSAKARSIDPFFVNNFRSVFTFRSWGLDRVDINLTINNILNHKYETGGLTWRQQFETRSNVIDHYNFYYPQAGTNFLLGVNIRF